MFFEKIECQPEVLETNLNLPPSNWTGQLFAVSKFVYCNFQLEFLSLFRNKGFLYVSEMTDTDSPNGWTFFGDES